MNSPVRSAVAKGETRLLDRVNVAITEIKKSGKLGAMANNWLKQPLPEGF